MTNPLVTCLCLTKGRPQWLPKAIECFNRQSYVNREMVVVADNFNDLVYGFPPSSTLLISPGLVGHKRNIGCEAARGDLIAIWDDDDFSAPNRLHYQVVRLIETGKQAHGFRDMKFTDGSDWWQYRGSNGFGIATSMMFTKDLWRAQPFTDSGDRAQCGQDEDFWNAAKRKGLTVSDEDKDLMYATIHAGNTSPRKTSTSSEFKPLKGFKWASR